MRRIIKLGPLVVASMLSTATPAYHQDPAPATAEVKVQLLDFQTALYLLGGGGSVSLVTASDHGAILIDTKLADSAEALLEALRLVTDQPVTTIINTHAHVDHVGGNTNLPSVTQIVAHERATAQMRQLATFQGANARFLPTTTVTDRLSLFEGQDRVDVYYFGAGHTNGDLVVVLPAAGIVHMGDLFPSKAAPFIDTSHGGSGVAFPETLARVLGEITGVRRVSTGHDPGLIPAASTFGELMSWADLQEYADFNRDFLEAVRRARDAGKTVEEAAETLVLPDRYKDYDMRRAPANVAAIYEELNSRN